MGTVNKSGGCHKRQPPLKDGMQVFRKTFFEEFPMKMGAFLSESPT